MAGPEASRLTPKVRAPPPGGTRTPLTYQGKAPAKSFTEPCQPAEPVDGFDRRYLLAGRCLARGSVFINELGSAILDLVDVTGILAAGLGVDEVPGLGDAVLDGLLVAMDQTLSLALKIVN